MLEKRTIVGRFELRAEGDNDTPPVLEGYASVFDVEYPVGPFVESVDRRAFNRTLSAQPDVRLLIDHAGQPLARTKSGTLQLTTDDHGLRVRAELDPADPDVQRLIPKMRRGDMDQMSFAFRVAANGDEWDYSNPSKVTRKLTELSLNGGDVSVVTYPASEATSVSVRDARHLFVEQTSRELRSGREIPRNHLLQLRRALAEIEAEARMTANDTAASISEAVTDAYSEQGWAYLEDYDETYVYFTLYTDGDSDMYRQCYSLAPDGMALLTGDAEQVRLRRTYVPVTDPDGDAPLEADGDTDMPGAPDGDEPRSAVVEAETPEQLADQRGMTPDDLRLLVAIRKAA